MVNSVLVLAGRLGRSVDPVGELLRRFLPGCLNEQRAYPAEAHRSIPALLALLDVRPKSFIMRHGVTSPGAGCAVYPTACHANP